MRRYLALMFCLLATVAARPQCDFRESYSECTEIDVTLLPGDCVEISIDCDTDWAQLGSFTVRDTFADLWVEIDRRPEGNTVRLCAGANMPVLVEEPLEYIDVRTDGEMFVGLLWLTTDAPLVADVTADPPVVLVGGQSQLNADVSGGAPPYTYTWSYSDAFVGAYNIADPVVEPGLGEIFGVVVRDAAGQRVSASVLVDVVPMTTVVAIPDTIDAGETVRLVFGASPTYLTNSIEGWSWTPDLPSGAPQVLDAASTSATPVVTTTYTFSIRTFYGTLVADTVTVYVRP